MPRQSSNRGTPSRSARTPGGGGGRSRNRAGPSRSAGSGQRRAGDKPGRGGGGRGDRGRQQERAAGGQGKGKGGRSPGRGGGSGEGGRRRGGAAGGQGKGGRSPGWGGGTGGRSGKPRSRDGHRGGEPRRAARVTPGSGDAELPKWMRDELRRVTGKERLNAATAAVTRAVEAFADEEYETARRELRKAKSASSRAACVRELLGLAAYHTGNWREAVAELRAYRRMTGDVIYMPAEMDALRAQGDREGVEKTWLRFREAGGPPSADSEVRVVYGSFLLDEGRPREAWSATGPVQLRPDPPPHLLRRWYVAARAAAALGDGEAARRLASAIREQSPDLPGLEELAEEIEQAERG